MNNKIYLQMAILALAALNGCTPTRVSDAVKLPEMKQWHHAADSASTTQTDLKVWWQGFQDPLLNELITQALNANHDFKIAAARVREAATAVTITESALYPSIDLSSLGGREKKIDKIIGVPDKQGIKLIIPTADAVSGGLTARWEIDLFGGRHLEAEAAIAQAAGTEEALRAVQVGLLAQVATNYLELRGLQKRISLQQETIAVQKEKLRALQLFEKNGLATAADIANQKTLLATTESALPLLTTAAQTLIHRISVLLGAPPAQFEKRLSQAMPLPAALPDIPKLLPSDLLAQRPDLRLAKTEVTAAAANLGAARADLFPKLVLSASGGFGAIAVGGFSTLAETVYTLGAGLTMPIFNAGRIQAHITAVDARLEQTALNYEKTFLLALEEVENAFVTHTAAKERQRQLSDAKKTAEAAYQSTEALYQRGVKDYLAVLEARRNTLAVSDEYLKNETAMRVSMVSLYRAFGGGWDAAAANQVEEENVQK
ncbi:Toluene efflux pump outer membrane protein TtgI [Anaerolineae bacterium]|nr:Toluene efflux pump outer membrane protein TtgI [Anaerolineae bacterium]